MFGTQELILILLIGLVVFGPGKLPEIGKALGKSIKEFKKATSQPAEEAKQPRELAEGKKEEKDDM